MIMLLAARTPNGYDFNILLKPEVIGPKYIITATYSMFGYIIKI